MCTAFKFEITTDMVILFEHGFISVDGVDGDGYAIEAERQLSVAEHTLLVEHLVGLGYPSAEQVRPTVLCGDVSSHVNSSQLSEINYVKA